MGQKYILIERDQHKYANSKREMYETQDLQEMLDFLETKMGSVDRQNRGKIADGGKNGN